MEISDIINAILAGLTLLGVIVALGMGVASIIQAKNLQRKQYKNILLDNILKWALDIPM
jgi:uncharacterized membrane protein